MFMFSWKALRLFNIINKCNQIVFHELTRKRAACFPQGEILVVPETMVFRSKNVHLNTVLWAGKKPAVPTTRCHTNMSVQMGTWAPQPGEGRALRRPEPGRAWSFRLRSAGCLLLKLGVKWLRPPYFHGHRGRCLEQMSFFTCNTDF